ncbi:archaeosortase/exosortase family protein [Geomonas propionica]|uniref:Archaeosortase/exosortase family protein n=1 Tax=Geomonas propionica TaxID=2798582 RepID=A0ABS0YYC0_9BACT|nr:archaeosortase/exosortase family protein [Geomonas propionica]MBJ6802492.1 archaeosortase/exosortase family protein [Geomonas propionica]
MAKETGNPGSLAAKDNSSRPFPPLLKTCLCFGGYMVLLHIVLWLAVPVWKGTDPLREFTTQTTSLFLNQLHIQNTVTGYSISLKNDTWLVTQECTAVNVLILFASFVLAYTASPRSKILALAAGIPFIVAANLTRLVTLGLLTDVFPNSAHFFHDFVWETVFVLLVIAMWLTWIKTVVMREENPSISG